MMEIALALTAGFILGFFIGRRQSSTNTPPKPQPSTCQSNLVPEELESRIKQYIERNKSIEAIKELRQATGIGLKEAKDIVDAMKLGHRFQDLIKLEPKTPELGADK